MYQQLIEERWLFHVPRTASSASSNPSFVAGAPHTGCKQRVAEGQPRRGSAPHLAPHTTCKLRLADAGMSVMSRR
jgi:hypothetical protein